MSKNFTAIPVTNTDWAAERLWLALRETMDTSVVLDEAKSRVPAYTAQWNPEDYYKEEQDRFNRAKERFYEVIEEICSDVIERKEANGH